jgi:hypothetical protein
MLPFIWLLGVFPQMDVFWLWLGEQMLVFVFGGTACITDKRLFVSVVLAVGSAAIVRSSTPTVSNPLDFCFIQLC